MNTKLISIIGIVATLIFVGLVAWVMLLPDRTPGGATAPTGGGGGFFYRGVVSTERPSTSTQTAQQTPPSMEKFAVEYDEVMNKLGGRKVVFTRVSSTAGTEGSVYALYTSEVAAAKKEYPSLGDYSLPVAMVDVTDDGVAEAFVYKDLPGHCGTAGCVLSIYKKEGTGWALMFETQVQNGVGIGNVVVNGHAVLLLTQQGGTNYTGVIRRYSWEEGKGYVDYGVAAIWDGTTFKTARTP